MIYSVIANLNLYSQNRARMRVVPARAEENGLDPDYRRPQASIMRSRMFPSGNAHIPR